MTRLWHCGHTALLSSKADLTELSLQCEHICSLPEKPLTPFSLQMEDDVEVELELEKQLALAHELFPT